MSRRVPNRVFEEAAIAAGVSVRCLWQTRGPRNTGIAFMECLAIGKSIAIVQTFEVGGWSVLTPFPGRETIDVLADAFARCGVPVGEEDIKRKWQETSS